MNRLQTLVLVVVAAGVALITLFPPWVEELELEDGSVHRDAHCCFDNPIWSPPQPVHGIHTMVLDGARLGRQLTALVGPGTLLFLLAGRNRRRRPPA